jgi:hypothetical protein
MKTRMGRNFYYVSHPSCLLCPSGKEWFERGELKAANVFAQRLANELGKTVTRGDVKGRTVTFHPAFPGPDFKMRQANDDTED